MTKSEALTNRIKELLTHCRSISIVRVPFTYHHDWMRTTHGLGSRSDVAQYMSWFKDKYGEDAYWAATALGALKYLRAHHPGVLRHPNRNSEIKAATTYFESCIETIDPMHHGLGKRGAAGFDIHNYSTQVKPE